MWVKTHDGNLVNLDHATRVNITQGEETIKPDGTKGRAVYAYVVGPASHTRIDLYKGPEEECTAYRDRLANLLGADSGEDREVRVL